MAENMVGLVGESNDSPMVVNGKATDMDLMVSQVALKLIRINQCGRSQCNWSQHSLPYITFTPPAIVVNKVVFDDPVCLVKSVESGCNHLFDVQVSLNVVDQYPR